MTASAKQGGVWREAEQMYVRVSGSWRLVDIAYTKVNGEWEIYHQRVIKSTISSQNNLVASSLFSPDDWASSTPKKIVISSGSVIGSTSPSVPALRTGTGRGGDLIIQNGGSIFGAGGVENSGVGGTAFQADQAVRLINNGLIYGGGGGGGKGGNGANGSYKSTERQPTSGYYQGNSGARMEIAGTSFEPSVRIRWFGGATTVNPSGGWTYLQGPSYGSSSSLNDDGDFYKYHEVARTRLVTIYTTGGVGGNGGRGQGSNHSLSAGVAGSAGGTGSGSGGTGGTGGGYGANGGAGGNGGSAGGLAGYALRYLSNITLTGTGGTAGRQA